MSIKPYCIRPAEARDVGALATLARQVFTQTYGVAIPQPALRSHLREQFSASAFAKQLGSSEAQLLVGVQSNRPAGYSRITTDPAPVALGTELAYELAQLYIADRHQGNGLGAALLDASMAAARSRGATTLWLCVWERNERAVAFYQRRGFRPAGWYDIIVRGIVFHDLVLVRDLDAADGGPG